MNEIEQKFFTAYLDYWGITAEDESCVLIPDFQIDIYKVDFIYQEKYVIEIDGHDFHKTKEQRFQDYQRERYLQKKGYTVIRFMGTEVFLNPEQCIEELLEIVDVYEQIISDSFGRGLMDGREGG